MWGFDFFFTTVIIWVRYICIDLHWYTTVCLCIIYKDIIWNLCVYNMIFVYLSDIYHWEVRNDRLQKTTVDDQETKLNNCILEGCPLRYKTYGLEHQPLYCFNFRVEVRISQRYFLVWGFWVFGQVTQKNRYFPGQQIHSINLDVSGVPVAVILRQEIWNSKTYELLNSGACKTALLHSLFRWEAFFSTLRFLSHIPILGGGSQAGHQDFDSHATSNYGGL